MVTLKGYDLKLFILTYLGLFIILVSIFFPWVKIYGTLPPPPSVTIPEQIHSIFDDGIKGWEILIGSNEGWGDIISIEMWIMMILLIILAIILPAIFYRKWKGLLLTGIISMLIVTGMLSIGPIGSATDVGWFPLIGYIIAFIGGVITLICSFLMKKTHPSPSPQARGVAQQRGGRMG